MTDTGPGERRAFVQELQSLAGTRRGWNLVTALRGPDTSLEDRHVAIRVKRITTEPFRGLFLDREQQKRVPASSCTVEDAKEVWQGWDRQTQQEVAVWLLENVHFWSHLFDGFLALKDPVGQDYLHWLQEELTRVNPACGIVL